LDAQREAAQGEYGNGDVPSTVSGPVVGASLTGGALPAGTVTCASADAYGSD